MAHRYDYQKTAVYSWENTRDQGDQLTQAEAMELTRQIYEDFNFFWQEPIVAVSKIETKSTARATSGVIRLANGWGHRKQVLLHEIAHIFCGWSVDQEHCSAHGPTFVKIYLMLIDRYMDGIDFTELVGSALQAEIDIDFDFTEEMLREGLTGTDKIRRNIEPEPISIQELVEFLDRVRPFLDRDMECEMHQIVARIRRGVFR